MVNLYESFVYEIVELCCVNIELICSQKYPRFTKKSITRNSYLKNDTKKE